MIDTTGPGTHSAHQRLRRAAMGIAISSLFRWALGTGGEYKIAMVGLDNAGKTTILYRLCAIPSAAARCAQTHDASPSLRRHLGEVITTNPTVGSNVEEVVHRNVRFSVWDLGGQEKLRKVWSTYYVGASAVILVIDSLDRDRLPSVREELAGIIACEVSPAATHPPDACPVRASPERTRSHAFVLSQELRRAALLVLANKQDLEGAMSPIEITQQLQLHLNKEHAWQIQPCSALTGDGLVEGMDWVAHTLQNKQ